MESETVTVYEAARILNVTSRWIRLLLAEERLPGAFKASGQWRIPAASLTPIKQRREAVSQVVSA